MRTMTYVVVAAAVVLSGCTRESIRVAIETQRRANDVEQAVFDRQHEALCILLYRDLEQRLAAAGGSLSGEQREALNNVWNERDLIEFWQVQHERTRALRMVGVDAALSAQQSVVDLLWKSVSRKMGRGEQALAGVLGEQLGAVGIGSE